MSIRPIIFSTPMIRAILDGRKTQTRRMLRIPAHLDGEDAELQHFQGVGPGLAAPMRDNPEHRCGVFQPFAVGDLLWVREAWWNVCASDGATATAPGSHPGRDAAFFVADHPEFPPCPHYRKRPSIHMPRWASRLTLRVTVVRIQRLLDISEDDALDEGFVPGPLGDPMPETLIGGGWTISSPGGWASAAGHFQVLWQELHPEWDGFSSPWVVAITFDVIRANVDEITVASEVAA